MLSLFSLLLLLVFAAPAVVHGRCEGRPKTCGDVPTANCHGFSPRFCERMKDTCGTKCEAEGCSCEWTQVRFACETGSSSCRWKGECVPNGPVITCASLSTEASCVSEGCQWVNKTTTETSNTTEATDIGADPTPATPPLKLNRDCMDQIEKIWSCLSTSRSSQCLDCSLGKKGIVVPEGGFRTCQDVEEEYCKAGSRTVTSGGFLTDCCGSCQEEVVEYLQCLYGCPGLSCNSSTSTSKGTTGTTTTASEEPPNATKATPTEAGTPTDEATVARNDNPNLRRLRDRLSMLA